MSESVSESVPVAELNPANPRYDVAAMRVLHCLSQRPSLTGSGITLDSLVRHADKANWEQRVVVGVPSDHRHSSVGGLAADRIDPLRFGTNELPFPVPGMSDVMPYESTVFSAMTDCEIEVYLDRWRRHLSRVVEGFRPHVIHSHHVWLMSAMLKDIAPDLPVVTHCHATGLRQMTLVPRMAERVRQGCRRNDVFVVLHRGHADELASSLSIVSDRIRIVGAGYRDDLFHPGEGPSKRESALLFIGKFSAAKGLPWLLDAFERIASRRPSLVLHIAGDGSGGEAEQLRERMSAMAPRVVLHGFLDQIELAHLMRQATVCVLPSFFEGLPLVLVEAMACGCRLVSTNLPGVAEELAPRLGDVLEMVDLPPMSGIDTPSESGLPAFVDRLEVAMERAVNAPAIDDVTAVLESFTWKAVFDRIEAVWEELARG